MVRLGKAARAHGIERLYFKVGPFDAAEIERFGVQVDTFDCKNRQRPMPGEWIAFSAHQLVRSTGTCRPKVPPSFEVDGHVFVYAP